MDLSDRLLTQCLKVMMIILFRSQLVNNDQMNAYL